MRLQGPQLRVARQDARFHYASLRVARGFHREQNVVKSHREQVQQNAGSEQKWEILRQPRVNPMKVVKPGQHPAKDSRRDQPHSTGNESPGNVCEQKSRQARMVEWRRQARVPRGQAYEGVQKAQNERDRRRLNPSQSARDCEQIGEHSREWNPAE